MPRASELDSVLAITGAPLGREVRSYDASLRVPASGTYAPRIARARHTMRAAGNSPLLARAADCGAVSPVCAGPAARGEAHTMSPAQQARDELAADQMQDDRARRIRAARALDQYAEDQREGLTDPLWRARRRVALRVTSGRGLLARRLRHGPRGLLAHIL